MNLGRFQTPKLHKVMVTAEEHLVSLDKELPYTLLISLLPSDLMDISDTLNMLDITIQIESMEVDMSDTFSGLPFTYSLPILNTL